MEICIDSLKSARNAIEGGADRLEVCSALSEGGLTPSPGLIKHIRSFANDVPLYAMIRIRGGDFVYSLEEIDAMLHDLKILKEHGANGFVFGALTADFEIDVVACERIVSAARPLPMTFHRAFDLTADPIRSMGIVADLGFQRILTSGQRDTALDGLEMIKTLLRMAQRLIIIMPGAGITRDNIRKIMESGAKEFHASAKRRKTVSHANKVSMGASKDAFVYVTDRELVMELVGIVHGERITAS